MPESNPTLLAQGKAITDQADELMAHYAGNFRRMEETSRRWLDTVCGDQSRNPDLIPAMEQAYAHAVDAVTAAQDFDRQELEAAREDAGV